MSELWGRCIERLETEFGAEEVQTYLKPLQARESEQGLRLLAPNDYTLEVVRERFLARIRAVIEYQHGSAVAINLGICTLGKRKVPGMHCTCSAQQAAPQLRHWGVRTRGARTVTATAKLKALTSGRYNVQCEAARRVFLPAMRHRLILDFEAQAEGIDTDHVLVEIIKKVAEKAEAAKA